MNESYERAINEISILKKTLNQQKNSHQNTLHQLQTTYQIINELKELLKNQQDKNKMLNREIKVKSQKITHISRQYEEHIINIKQLIDRKDIQIEKYSTIKITDYDMIRLRIINEISHTHSEEIQGIKNEMSKLELINSEQMYRIKILEDKNQQYEQQIINLKQNNHSIKQQIENQHVKQINRFYHLLEQQKITNKQLQRKFNEQKLRNTQLINKYHQQLNSINDYGKQNNRNYKNVSTSSTLINVKQSNIILENQKMKKQFKTKQDQFNDIKTKNKNQINELKQKIFEGEKQIQYLQQQLKRSTSQLQQTDEQLIKQTTQLKKDNERKISHLKETYDDRIYLLQKEINQLKKNLNEKQYSKTTTLKETQSTYQQTLNQQTLKLKKENEQLKNQIKNYNIEFTNLKTQTNHQIEETRNKRSVSVKHVKDKLDAANVQIVNLLKQKIALNKKIETLNSKN